MLYCRNEPYQSGRLSGEKAEKEKLLELKKKLEKTIEDSPTLSKFKNQLILDITTEGLRVQIVDEQNRPMFESAKAELQPYAKQILKEICPHKININLD